ncbi:MAG: DNA-directed RNA polymerase subunit beta [Clostridia bacterium]|nr:DNA-directed RNA polymerase subunit beta [Clostridia bacterium]MBQ7913671.1 DNA-directed RNA polymerase subunit beta [Clostridia bacterium]
MDLPISKYGKTERRKFGSINEVIDIPDLVEIQKDSYNTFIEEGISEVFEDFSPITDYSDRFELYFLEHRFGDKPKYDEKECRTRDANYELPLRVKVRLVNKVTGQLIDQEVFMGNIPLMTENGSFIINGAERVIVSQLVRSPGVYNASSKDKTGKEMFKTTVMPNRGAWLELEQDAQDALYVRVDRKKKLPVTALLRALGYGSNRSIDDLFAGDKMIATTITKDTAKSESDGLYELYRRLRPGEAPTEESVRAHLFNLFFESRRYDIAKVGRYKYNKKLCLSFRLEGCRVADNVINPETGEVIAEAGEKISEIKAKEIQNCGIGELFVLVDDPEDGEIRHKMISNNTVDFTAISDVPVQARAKDFGLLPTVHYPTFRFSQLIAKECAELTVEEVAEKYTDDINELFKAIEKAEEPDEKPEEKKNREKRRENRRKFVAACQVFHAVLASEHPVPTKEQRKEMRPLIDKLCHKHVTVDDIVASISSNLDLRYGIGTTDNIDHLGNRRVRSVGELLQNNLRIGIARLERLIKERMGTQDPMEITPSALINIRPVSAVIREFFGSSQLSQFMDQTNPIAELTHKRKLSALGPGGLNRDRATFDVRDIHHTHYGRMCPIETPEGQNIGLITSLATFARVNEYGFIMSPYRRVDKATGIVTTQVDYLTADEEDKYIVAQANEPLDEESKFINERVGCRHQNDITEMPREKMDYMDVSPKQLVSVAAALIPFLENDDTNRALMGSNMQRQAVPLLKTESAIVATGIESSIAQYSGVIVTAREAGVVVSCASNMIKIREEDGTIAEYPLKKFERSNAGTCLNQRPIVSTGDRVFKGEIIADGPSTNNGELALGKNILVGYMEWEGYNYEDAILLSEKLVQDDVFTSIHIEKHEIEARDTKLGPEEITRDIPNVGDDALKDLDEDGIIRIGAEVQSGDILVGKVSPKGEAEPTPEERLLRAIFGEKSREVRDTSLKVPHGEGGVVVDVKVFTRENKDELDPGVNKLVRVYIAQKRKIQVGDKMAGRHGNKGVISRVLSQADMPFLADGTPLQILLNPLGVPSRMNIGQVLEVHLGYVCKQLGWKIATPVFDGATEKDLEVMFRENNLLNPDGKVDGKFQVFDGRTGEPFENRVTIGVQYMIKLIHLVDDKIHARAIGPYSLVTQQPLGGKAQFGGQRFGEMEVWALEAYGAAHILQEILTVKSDDVVGRVKTYESIVRGENISEPGIPEAFKVLLKELQSLALDVKVLTESGDELVIREVEEEENERDNVASRREAFKDEDLEEIDFNVDDDEDFDDEDDDVKSIFDEDGDDEDGFNIAESDDEDFDDDEDDDSFDFSKLFEAVEDLGDEDDE